MKPSLIIFDIDETLYDNRKKSFPASTLDALTKLKQAGHALAIATGRGPHELLDEIKELSIDFYILANGQLVMQNDEVIYENAIELDILEEIMVAADTAGVYLGFSSATRTFLTGMTDEMRKAFAGYQLPMPEISKDIKSEEPIHQIWYFSKDYMAIAEKFKEKLRFLPWLRTPGADILPIGVSKALALTKMVEASAGDIYEKTVFFGDGMNDIELIEMADIGVAMGNATPPVKEVANFVTKNIEDDGIYYACEQLGLFETNANE